MINNLLGWQCENERYQETIRCLHYAEYDGQRECCFTRLLKEWAEMDSNHRRQSQQIYSLPHLATLESALKRKKVKDFFFTRQLTKTKNENALSLNLRSQTLSTIRSSV
jgi:hypothetical protein